MQGEFDNPPSAFAQEMQGSQRYPEGTYPTRRRDRNGNGNGNGGDTLRKTMEALKRHGISSEHEVSKAEMEARYGHWWHNMDLATAPPPALGRFTGGFRTCGFTGNGGMVITMNASKVFRLSIEPWNKMAPIWYNKGTDEGDHIGHNPYFKNDVTGRQPWTHYASDGNRVGPLPAPPAAPKRYLAANIAYAGPGNTPNFPVPLLTMTDEMNGEFIQNSWSPLPYTNINPVSCGFTETNDYAFFMGGYIEAKVLVPQGSSGAEVMYIGQNEVRGIGIGTVGIEPSGYPLNQGFHVCMDPNRLDFKIKPEYLFYQTGHGGKVPDKLIPGEDPAQRCYVVPIVPAANGPLRMFTPIDNNGVAKVPTSHLDGSASLWMGVISHEADTSVRNYHWKSYRSDNINPMDFSTLDQPELFVTAGVPPVQTNYEGPGPFPYCAYDYNPDAHSGLHPEMTPMLGSHLLELVELIHVQASKVPAIGDATISLGADPQFNVPGIKEGCFWDRCFKIWMDQSFRTRRASPSPMMSMVAGYPLFEVKCGGSTPGTAATVILKYKMFYQYIIGIDHPNFEMSQGNQIYDLDVEDYRLQAAPMGGAGNNMQQAAEYAKKVALYNAQDKIRRDMSLPIANPMTPKAGITPPINHDSPGFFDLVLGAAKNYVTEEFGSLNKAAQWLWRTAVPAAAGLINPELGLAAVPFADYTAGTFADVTGL